MLVTSGSDYFVRACLACKSDGINRPANAVCLLRGEKRRRMINSAIVIGSVTVHENGSRYFMILVENTYEFVGRFLALASLSLSPPPLKVSLP